MMRQIGIGKHSILVQEVLDFIKSNKILSGDSCKDKIVDLDKAKKMAWEKLYGDDELTWADIRSEKMSEVWRKLYADPNFAEIDNILSQLQLDISKIIKYQLHDQYKDLLDDVLSDLKGCIYSRAIEGGTNAFFEQIFSAYKTGCWPCGWNGEWPEGKIFIYCPKTNNQTEIAKTMRNSN